MKRSQNRILTTHVGSLVRPKEVVATLQRKADGQPFSEGERALLGRHVAEAVRLQAACGIDVPSDGEYSKTGFSQYITDRLTGFELRTRSEEHTSELQSLNNLVCSLLLEKKINDCTLTY